MPLNVVDGVRVNTGEAYLNPARGRPNLRVVGGCRVLRVVLDGTRATGVEVLRDGALETVHADEVVLCAGGIGTPHLLLVSGIGPAGQLRAAGVPVVVDAPGVGAAFSDHPDLSIGWRARRDLMDPRTPETFTTALNLSSGEPVPDASGAPGAPGDDLEVMVSVKSMSWLLTGRRSMFAGGARAALRHPIDTLRALRGTSLARVREQAAHGRDLSLLVGLQREQARGSITLASADPTEQPRIDYRYLSTASDRARLRVGVRTAVALLRSPSFAGLVERLTELDDATVADDAALDAWMRAHLGTAIHLCGSAPMGPADAPGSVVDAHGLVHGVTGLRVADTSMLPDTPSRGPAATAVLIGESAAAWMRAERAR
ncbi:hypothetical protein GCM10025877_11660 [Agromyces mangrovi Wang et al. 2018]|nr:hypothetical protein GCM10025877_11660 [Agromyces mangrovi]